MSEQTVAASFPQWDLADRMRKALRVAGVSVQDMADYLDVARNTASTWINGRITPSGQTVRLWSLRCGVDYEWLRTGHPTQTGPDGGAAQFRCTAPRSLAPVVRLDLDRTARPLKQAA